MTGTRERDELATAPTPQWVAELTAAMTEVQHHLDQLSAIQDAHRDMIGLRLDDQAAKIRELLPALVDEAVEKTLASRRGQSDALASQVTDDMVEVRTVRTSAENLARPKKDSASRWERRAARRAVGDAREALDRVISQQDRAEDRERRKGELWRRGAVALLGAYVVTQVVSLATGWLALGWDAVTIAQHTGLAIGIGCLIGFCMRESRRHLHAAKEAEDIKARMILVYGRIVATSKPEEAHRLARELIELLFIPGKAYDDRSAPAIGPDDTPGETH